MNQTAVAFAKLAAIKKTLAGFIANPRHMYFDPKEVTEYFEAFCRQLDVLKQSLPVLFDDVPDRPLPTPTDKTSYEGRGIINRDSLEQYIRDIDYIFEVRAHSELATPMIETSAVRRIFISHGRANYWREVQTHIDRDLQIPTLELAQEPNRGRTVLQKLEEESNRCSYAVVVMSGDDRTEDGEPRARENVMHEIGYFQGKFGLARVCLLHEEGTGIPSNIHGLVYIPFPPGLVSAAFGPLGGELRDAFE